MTEGKKLTNAGGTELSEEELNEVKDSYKIGIDGVAFVDHS